MSRDVVGRLTIALILAGVACKGGAEPTAKEGPWPNEPAGFTLISDYAFSDPLPVGQDVPVSGSDGWNITNSGLARRVSDGTAPVSPSFVGQWSYPVGFPGGDDPATIYKVVGGGNELYIGFYWKVSKPWQDHPVANKIAFQFAGGGGAGGQMFIAMWSGTHQLVASTEFSTDFRNLDPNVNATAVTLGVWHRVEWYANRSTNTMKWWLDGVLQGNYTNIKYPPEAFDEFKFAPTWGGGTGVSKTEQDYFWYDDVRLSKR